MTKLRSIYVLTVVLLLLPIAGATSVWSVSTTDPEGDATKNPNGDAHESSCPATDLVSGSVTYDGSNYIWSFTVKDILAGCAPCVWHFRVIPGAATCAPWTAPGGQSFPTMAGYLTFTLYKDDGSFVDSVKFSQGGLFETGSGMNPWRSEHGVGFFTGNTGTVVLPGFMVDLEEAEMFRMSAFVDNTVFPFGCIPGPEGGCVYSYRDEMYA